MEDALREEGEASRKASRKVLILVVMEDALRDQELWQIGKLSQGLNPCCNGRCSQRNTSHPILDENRVLILVVMEDALRGSTKISTKYYRRGVLILVVMEDALREQII